MITLQDLFIFEKRGITEEGRVRGRFAATGIRPKFADRLAVSGVPLSADIFQEGQVL